MGFPKAVLSIESQEKAKQGNYKAISIEQAKIYIEAKIFHNKQCVRNAKSAREYQTRMQNDL